MPTDRAQDTEAIRAALRHASETVYAPGEPYFRHPDYCEGCKADAALGRLVARLEADERVREALGLWLAVLDEVRALDDESMRWVGKEATENVAEAERRARAALAAAAPGETEQTP